jgi:opacity protein-like surface antigen
VEATRNAAAPFEQRRPTGVLPGVQCTRERTLAMSKRVNFFSAFAALTLGTVSVNAADLGGMRGGGMKDGGYMPAIQQSAAVSSGIYLRGDVAWANQSFSSMYEPPAYQLSHTSIENTRSWGVGIGRYFSSNIRGDLTFDWRGEAGMKGSVLENSATVRGERQFGVKNMVALANLYYDFDTRSRFTPYIGVGLGFARNTTSAGSVNVLSRTTDNCNDGYTGGAVPGPTHTCSATFDGATKTNAAGALMAGFSAKLHDRLHLDAGYRFLYLGGANTGDIVIKRTIANVAQTDGAADPIIHDLTAHEFRVGLRWNLNR